MPALLGLDHTTCPLPPRPIIQTQHKLGNHYPPRTAKAVQVYYVQRVCARGCRRGAWHALTLSFCQQLLGPVRLCADVRMALESGSPPRPQTMLPRPLACSGRSPTWLAPQKQPTSAQQRLVAPSNRRGPGA